MQCRFRFIQAEQKLDQTLATKNVVSIVVGLLAEYGEHNVQTSLEVHITPRIKLTKEELRNFVMKKAIEHNWFDNLRTQLAQISGNPYVNNSFQTLISFDVLDETDEALKLVNTLSDSPTGKEVHMYSEENIASGPKIEEFVIESEVVDDSEEKTVSVNEVTIKSAKQKKKKK